MKKVLTVVGARPQFVKAAAVSRKLRSAFDEVLVHTGQHYDSSMSEIFFEELKIPKPDINLAVGSDTHARQTAKILVGIEDLIRSEMPDCLLTYGDTNSTLGASLAASKMNLPIVHVEAGLRSFNMKMPEEQNRILTDRLSTFLFCPTDTAVSNLKKENIFQNVYNVGDVMCDAVKFYSEVELQDGTLNRKYFDTIRYIYQELNFDRWYLATIHRAENTDNIEKICQILSALEELDEKVLFPVHPRIRKMVDTLYKKHGYKNIAFVEPFSYLQMLYFTSGAKTVITDSGGLQKEAFMLGVDCVTVRDQTEWVETLINNYNVLCSPCKEDILEKVLHTERGPEKRVEYYGDGHAADKIVKILKESL